MRIVAAVRGGKMKKTKKYFIPVKGIPKALSLPVPYAILLRATSVIYRRWPSLSSR